MLEQRYKDIYLNFLQIPNKLNFLRYKFIPSSKFYKGNSPNLNLGSGKKYLDGFVNIDANIFRKKELWLDIRNGLPFKDSSVESIYSHSLFEHLYPRELINLLKECRRILGQGCGMRVVVPNLDVTIKGYIQKDLSWISDFPRHFNSLGGKFYNFIFCDGQHKLCFDLELMQEFLTQAGFNNIIEMESQKSQVYSNTQIKEEPFDPAHLYVECVKN